jgi:hypothetical protein
MKFGVLDINPAKNPAVLDTVTWDTDGVRQQLQRLSDVAWEAVYNHLKQGKRPQSQAGCTFYPGSAVHDEHGAAIAAELVDGQHVLLEFSREQTGGPGPALHTKPLPGGYSLRVYPADAVTLDRFCRQRRPDKGPQALGATPRLGIGVRMSQAVWPGIWSAMARKHFAANAIQNSLRELNLLDDVLAGNAPHTNYLFSFGAIDEGHTGSTYEGLWTAGVLSALKSPTQPVYGADADHIMVKRGPEGLPRAKQIIQAARYYTFFTLDVSDILNYAALNETSTAAAEAFLTELLPEASKRTAVIAYHQQLRHLGGQEYHPDRAALGRLVGKYWNALDAAQALHGHIVALKQGIPFDLELSIDENPPDVQTCASLTRDSELMFLLVELRRRELSITHIAPNFGVEKGTDYRCPGGLEELEGRVRRLYRIARESGIMLDCHSGDDLSSKTRRVFGQATEGHLHFKISPSLQVIFGETLEDLYPERFQFWWDDTLAYARREAERGASTAIDAFREYERQPKPSARTSLFQHFNFATVGKRDAEGQFRFRERFYDLPAEFYAEYAKRIERQLSDVAEDIFQS